MADDRVTEHLTAEDVRQIRALWAERQKAQKVVDDLSLRKIGEKFGVGYNAIWHIVHRKTFKWVI